MPNWCNNSVFITAEKARIDAIVEALELDQDRAHISKESRQSSCWNEDVEWSLFNTIRPARKDTDWDAHYGTNREAAVEYYEREDDETILIAFQSAWRPPVELYEWMVLNGYTVAAAYMSYFEYIGWFQHGQSREYAYKEFSVEDSSGEDEDEDEDHPEETWDGLWGLILQSLGKGSDPRDAHDVQNLIHSIFDNTLKD
jgi:hypothetical protein